ncbi:MAG: D-alanyl-D-alanine carboxypeptidase family protein [Actinomycetota bacterium]
MCDLGADRELGRALTGWFGTDTFNGAVRAEVAAVRDADRRLQASSPSAVLAGPTARVELADVGGILVRIDIADDVAAMLVAATIDGVRLQGSGWRSHERQIELRAQNCADVWETPPSQCSPPTAIPGTSGHEVGEAIDFFVLDDGVRRAIRRDDPQFAWLGAHAAEYGLFNLPSEPWHWSTTGG